MLMIFIYNRVFPAPLFPFIPISTVQIFQLLNYFILFPRKVTPSCFAIFQILTPSDRPESLLLSQNNLLQLIMLSSDQELYME